jgi:hypothetical protein
MFISNQEKKYLFDQIKSLSKDMSLAASEITFLKAKIKILDAKPAPVVKPKKPTTIAQKAKQREYMRRYKAKKAAEKLALEQA